TLLQIKRIESAAKASLKQSFSTVSGQTGLARLILQRCLLVAKHKRQLRCPFEIGSKLLRLPLGLFLGSAVHWAGTTSGIW
ncbi:hypothetical protein MB818_20850, partial [Ruegeria sp. 1NDH52C]